MLFVKVSNNRSIFESNNNIIDNALFNKKISMIQATRLQFTNWKWFNYCKHKGMLCIEDNKMYFIPLVAQKQNEGTSTIVFTRVDFIRFNKLCNITKENDLIRFNKLCDVFKDQDFLRLNKLCNIIKEGDLIKLNKLCNSSNNNTENYKWILVDINNYNIESQNVNDRTEIKGAVVGDENELDQLQEWVNTLNWKPYDISTYFQLEDAIEELVASNVAAGIIITDG